MTISTCNIQNKQIAYLRQGEGGVVLLVHGLAIYSFIWKEVVPLLEDNYQIICIYLPGCGASSKEVDQPYSIKYHAFLLKKFMDKLGIEKFHSVGYDIGGGTGQRFWVNYPELLHHMVVINTVGYDFFTGPADCSHAV